MFSRIAVLAALCACIAAAPWKTHLASVHPKGQHALMQALQDLPYANFTQTQLWYSQTLDHFDLTNKWTFSQRYWIVSDFWSPPTGPILLYICGEYTCPGVMASRLFPMELAYEHNALVVVLEHRFYGQSYPFNYTSPQNLGFLNSRQAISDLAQFTTFIQGQVNQNYSLPATTKNQWFVIGGSYPGALSAWYRLKFPHLSVGALSSSGVVNAFVEYPQFDQQVATSAGAACTSALQTVTQLITAGMPAVKATFGASQLSDGDFYFFVADAAAEGIQYGYKHVLCDPLVAALNNGQNPLPVFVNYTVNFWEAVLGNSASDYDSTALASPITGGDGRSWWWQICTEVGWWQIAPASNSIRSQNVNNSWYAGFCSKLFGFAASNLPDTNSTNTYYGGADIAGYNIFFSNGVEDPWQWAGVRATINPVEQAIVVNCDDCAHCVDLYTPTSQDAPELVAERNTVKNLLNGWLSQ